jgi:cytochrome P450
MEMHHDDEFSKSFDYASGATAERFQNPLWPITELFTGAKLRKSIAVVKDFGRRIVAKAVQDRNEGTLQKQNANSPNQPSNLDRISGTLIQSLLDAIPDEPTVADAALTYLSAGRDTTGQALTWTFYLLLRHPAVTTKIRAEVQHLLSQHPDQNPQTPNPVIFTPASVPYTLAAFHEALRLYPPIPFEIRQCQADTTLPDGTFLPRDSVLVWCLWAMQRSKLTWGQDADEFRPERWLDGNGRFVARSAAEFPVFYGGARACLGRKMAEGIAAQVVPSLVWAFEFEAGFDEAVARRSSTSLTLPMEGGLPVRVRGRVWG